MSRKNSETRDRILQCAWKLLESGSDNSVRMSDIAKNAGVSRQAVYLHFPSRAELLIAVTRYIDEVKNVDGRLSRSRSAENGLKRMDEFIVAWGNYIPEIYGVARALIAMRDTDEEADLAWRDRMNAVRHGCEAAVKMLAAEGRLLPGIKPKQATDLLWTLLSVQNWEQLTVGCGWSQKQYLTHMRSSAHRMLVSGD